MFLMFHDLVSLKYQESEIKFILLLLNLFIIVLIKYLLKQYKNLFLFFISLDKMVRINAITLINRFIEEKNILPMKNWALRNMETRSPRYKQYKEMVQNIRKLLNIISGDNIVALLKSILCFLRLFHY